MKKIATTFLLILYTTFSVGATVHLHYCMDKFVSSSLFCSSADACSNCGMEKHNNEDNCCKDIKVTLKLSDKHFSSVVTPLVNLGFAYFQIPFLSYEPIGWPSPVNLTDQNEHSPPELYSAPVFILHRNLRI